MAKKPSEWTPQELFEDTKRRVAEMVERRHSWTTAQEILALPFPADPPEVVRQIVLVHGSDGGALTKDEIRMVCAELLARREAERKA